MKFSFPKVSWPGIKLPEVGVFGCLPVSVLCLVVVLFSSFFPYWAESSLVEVEGESGEARAVVEAVYIGLFSFQQGSKTLNRGGECHRPLAWVCSDGYCMNSCGETSDLQEADIKNILSPTYNSSLGDDTFCSPCNQAQQIFRDRSSSPQPFSSSPPSSLMVRRSMLLATQSFLLIGLIFTFINIVFNAINIILTPVSAIVGVDGLVLWNSIAALSYLLVLLLWGAEFNMKLRDNPGISDSLRPGDIIWEVDSSMGWCCLLLILPLLLHLALAANLGYRQYKRYYSSKKRTEAAARLQVQDPTQGGTDILF